MDNSERDLVIQYGRFLTDERMKFLENYRKEFSDLLKYGETLMGILAVIGGFGFTAFQFIRSPIFFFTGEGLLILPILYINYRSKSYISGQPISTEAWINEFMIKAREVKKAIIDDSPTDLKRLADEFKTKLVDTEDPPILNASKNISDSFQKAFWIAAIGIILVLLSFIFIIC